MPSLVGYTGTKFAVRGMTKAAAMELGPQGHPGQLACTPAWSTPA